MQPVFGKGEQREGVKKEVIYRKIDIFLFLFKNILNEG